MTRKPLERGWMTTEQAMTFLGMSRNTIKKHLKDGKLVGFRLAQGRGSSPYRISIASVQRLLGQHKS